MTSRLHLMLSFNMSFIILTCAVFTNDSVKIQPTINPIIAFFNVGHLFLEDINTVARLSES